MNSQIGLGIFGTFGEPHGFQQVFYYGAHFQGTLDLNDAAIEFYPGAELFSVRREIVDGVHSICISIYSYARELNTERFGTFIGSCMVLQDGFAEAEYIYKVLHSLHEDLITNEENIENGIIKVAQGTDVIIREPAELVAAQANIIPLNKTPFFSSFVDEGKKILVIPTPHSFGNKETEVMEFLDEALKHYSDTGTLYFSFDRNVYEFVRSAGVISTLEWDDFKGRKAQMQRSTAVRTKKGIQKAVSIPLPVEEASPYVAPIAQEEENVLRNSYGEEERFTGDHDEDDTYSTATDTDDDLDPHRPFDLWEDPQSEWSETEVAYRVNEYNRLFRYTNKLVDHINEPAENGKRNRRKRALAAAALLLLLIGGSVALYFMGVFQPSQEMVKTAVLESPRSIQQGNIASNEDSMTADGAIATTTDAGTPSQEIKYASQTVMPSGVSDAEIERALADAPATPANTTTPNNSAVQQRTATNTGIANTTAIPATTNSTAQNNVPGTAAKNVLADAKGVVATGTIANATNNNGTKPTVPATPAMAANNGGDASGSMPQISMPSMPRANIPAAASYVSRIGKWPQPGAGTNTNSNSNNTGIIPGTVPAGQPTANNSARPATAETVRPGAANGAVPPMMAPIGTKTGLVQASPNGIAVSTPTTVPAATTFAANNKPGIVTGPATSQPAAALAAAPAATRPGGITKLPMMVTGPATTAVAPGRVSPATAAAPVLLAKTNIGATSPSAASLLPIGKSSLPSGPATAAVPAAARSVMATTMVNPVPATATPATAIATNGAVRAGSMTPTPAMQLGVSPTAANAKTVGTPSVTAPAAAGGQRTTTANPLAMTGPIPSGVSSGEMNRANAVVMPSLGMTPDQIKMKSLYPRPNGQLTQRDIPILKQNGIRNKTLTELTKLIIDNSPEDVGQYYRGQELQYAAALLNSNRQAFQRSGNDYICTADYLILHIPAVIKARRPVTSPK